MSVPECDKKDTCKNYEKKCSQCWATSSIYDTHPCYTSKDLVEVVRCKDCKNARYTINFYIKCGRYNSIMQEMDFCSRGERR